MNEPWCGMKVPVGEAMADTKVTVLGKIERAGEDDIASWNDGGG